MDKYERAQVNHEFESQVLKCRDLLEPIITGMIERGHCLAGFRVGTGGKPGKRKTTLKDAVAIAKTIEVILNKAVNDFSDAYRKDEG